MTVSIAIGCNLALSVLQWGCHRNSVVQVGFAPLTLVFYWVILQVCLADMALPAGQVAPVHSGAMVAFGFAIPDEEPPPFLQGSEAD